MHLPLTPFGWTNCTAFSQSDIIKTIPTNWFGFADYALAIPNSPSLDGVIVYGQWLGIDTTEPGNLTFSDMTRVIVGEGEF